ncbi:MAG: hypothetical protein ACTSSP_00335 [Candidatus Asgardarchaeia archaeon]
MEKKRRKKINSLLNRAGLKAYIKERCKTHRLGWDCTRVSDAAIIEAEGKFRKMVNDSVSKHPTRGKTFAHFD